jgi:hypothetical protein
MAARPFGDGALGDGVWFVVGWFVGVLVCGRRDVCSVVDDPRASATLNRPVAGS